MCLILFSWKTHPVHKLIVAANRDEFYDRPTLAATYWEASPKVLAGRDKTAGGTWMGMTKNNRFAALTNYREPKNINPNAPSRGELTKVFLEGDAKPKQYLESIKNVNKPYNGFNLLIGDGADLWYYNNVNHQIVELKPGTYGLSNALINDPWPKTISGMQELEVQLADDSIQPDRLFQILENKSLAPDDQLPATGVPIAWERLLSSRFITSENYGTRCSTVIISDQKKTTFIEKTHAHQGQEEALVSYDF